jgi:hypothetical protein
MTHVGKRGRLVPVDGDEKAFGIETVHLNEPVLVRDGAIDDQEDEVVVLVKLCPLSEVLGVFKSERMKMKDIAKYGEALPAWPGEVDLEKAAACE